MPVLIDKTKGRSNAITISSTAATIFLAVVPSADAICKNWPGVCFYLCGAHALHLYPCGLWEYASTTKNNTVSYIDPNESPDSGHCTGDGTDNSTDTKSYGDTDTKTSTNTNPLLRHQ